MLCCALAGCASQTPYMNQAPGIQIEEGRPCAPIDLIGNILSIPWKILLLEWRFGNHTISPQTEAILTQYLHDRSQDLSHTLIRVNQYAPHKDLKRLITNHQIAWPYRLIFGSLSLVVETVLPGRIFGGSLLSDYYDPWTDTIHLFSDHPAIGLHELGHAYDFSQQPYKGTYGLLTSIFIVRLNEEWQATDEAISYLVSIGDRRNELRAYKILYPAFGSYLGSYLIPLPFANVPGILIGHVAGRAKASARARFYRQFPAPVGS